MDHPSAAVRRDGRLCQTELKVLQTARLPAYKNHWRWVDSYILEMAGRMKTAGLTARVQFGEVLWWYFANASGMAFYDAYKASRFQTQYGRPLHTFLTPNDDPSVNGYVDANFLRQTVKDHVDAIRSYVLAAHPNATFELLWPLERPEHPPPQPLHQPAA